MFYFTEIQNDTSIEELKRENTPENLLTLGLMYNNGFKVFKSLTIAFDYFQQAANQGNTEASLEIWKLYKSNQNYFRENHEQIAFSHLQQAANQGNTEALLEIWKQLKFNCFSHLQQAANQGNTEALLTLGLIHMLHSKNNNLEIIKNNINNFFEERDLNETHCLNFVNNHYCGQNVPQYEEYLLKAGNLGNANALVILGLMHLFGTNIVVDKEKSLEYFLNAIYLAKDQQPIEISIGYIQNLLLDNIPIPYKKILDYFERAATEGNDNALIILALIYKYSIIQNTKKLDKYTKKIKKKHLFSKKILTLLSPESEL